MPDRRGRMSWQRTLDEHLFGAGPKRILSLDGGGVRGLITLGMIGFQLAVAVTGVAKKAVEAFAGSTE